MLDFVPLVSLNTLLLFALNILIYSMCVYIMGKDIVIYSVVCCCFSAFFFICSAALSRFA